MVLSGINAGGSLILSGRRRYAARVIQVTNTHEGDHTLVTVLGVVESTFVGVVPDRLGVLIDIKTLFVSANRY